MGVKIGSSVIVHPFPKRTCSHEGNAQGKDNFPNSEILSSFFRSDTLGKAC